MAKRRLLRGVQLSLVDSVKPYALPCHDAPAISNESDRRDPHPPKLPTPTIEALIRAADALPDAELQQLQEAITTLLEVRNLGDNNEPKPPKNRTLKQNDPINGRGSIEEKQINGCGPYRYLRWWSGGKHKSVYLGKVKEED